MKFTLNATMSVGAMLSLRFCSGALILALLIFLFRVPFQKRAVLDGLYLGLALTIVFWLQADGLRFTTTSKSGFITGLYVLTTPMVSLLAGDRLKRSHMVGALVATLGLYMLVHEKGTPFGGWNWGDSETLLCAVACGFHLVMTTHFSRRSSGWILALMQVLVVAVASSIITVFLPPPHGFQGMARILAEPSVWYAIGYQAVLATALGFWGMSTFQAHLGATEAAIIYSLEPVYTALIAMSGLVPGVKEHLGGTQLAGGALILSAMVLAELGPRWLTSVRAAEDDAIG